MLKKKSLGQHFLRSESALHKIVEAGHLSLEDTVLEVGPGEGVLTKLLLERAGRVIAVEKDDRLIPILQIQFASEIASGKFQLVHADILDLDFSSYKLKAISYNSERGRSEQSSVHFDGAKELYETKCSYKLVANIPYYITGALLRKFLESDTQPTMMVLLLQKEVAKRIVAQDKKESILSISVKIYGTPKYIDTVKAGAFSPPPNVDSAIIAIENISKKSFGAISGHSRECGDPGITKGNLDSPFQGNDTEKRFFALLKKGFAHPRKLLASNLDIDPLKLTACGIAEKARPENLSVEDWKRLSALLNS